MSLSVPELGCAHSDSYIGPYPTALQPDDTERLHPDIHMPSGRLCIYMLVLPSPYPQPRAQYLYLRASRLHASLLPGLPGCFPDQVRRQRSRVRSHPRRILDDNRSNRCSQQEIPHTIMDGLGMLCDCLGPHCHCPRRYPIISDHWLYCLLGIRLRHYLFLNILSGPSSPFSRR